MRHQLVDKFFGRSRREFLIELENQEVRDAKGADQIDFVLARRKQVRRIVRP